MSPKIWDLLDRLFQCRIQWICDRNEQAITGEPLTCDEETMITEHGIRYDYSVPRFCNRERGHKGEHIYTPT